MTAKTKMPRITWTNKKARLGDLKPYDKNPRTIDDEEGERLDASLDEFNQSEVFLVGPKLELYDGHQRRNRWLAKMGPDFLVDVRQSSKPLTEDQRKRLIILTHRGAVGHFDDDLLRQYFDRDLLAELGFDEAELEKMGFEIPDFKEFDESVKDDVEMIKCPHCGKSFPR